jgi:hypothetical protein
VVERAEVDQLDRGRAVVPDAVVAGSLDAVGVVAGALDDPRVGPVATLPLGLTSTDR